MLPDTSVSTGWLCVECVSQLKLRFAGPLRECVVPLGLSDEPVLQCGRCLARGKSAKV